MLCCQALPGGDETDAKTRERIAHATRSELTRAALRASYIAHAPEQPSGIHQSRVGRRASGTLPTQLVRQLTAEHAPAEPVMASPRAQPATASATTRTKCAALAEKYEVLNELGRGSFGTVSKVRCKESGEELASKA